MPLFSGRERNSSLSQESLEKQDREKLLRLAQGWLRQREFTRFEVHAALSRAGAPAAQLASLLDTLTEQGLLDDRRVAWRYVLRRSARLRGPEIICRELQERGVHPDLARELVGQIPGEEWQRYAARVLERYAGTPHSARRPPLHGPEVLLRMRGFRRHDIAVVLKETKV